MVCLFSICNVETDEGVIMDNGMHITQSSSPATCSKVGSSSTPVGEKETRFRSSPVRGLDRLHLQSLYLSLTAPRPHLPISFPKMPTRLPAPEPLHLFCLPNTHHRASYHSCCPKVTSFKRPSLTTQTKTIFTPVLDQSLSHYPFISPAAFITT